MCATDFIGFVKAAEIFKSRNCELLGLSIDSPFSHLTWTRTIQAKFGVKIPSAIIEDIKVKIAHACGRVHPGAADTQAVRATFFIDPNAVLRAMLCYPISNGRSINEFVRQPQAMQTSDKGQIATPEGWTPRCKVIVPPPKTADAADRRAGEGYKRPTGNTRASRCDGNRRGKLLKRLPATQCASLP